MTDSIYQYSQAITRELAEPIEHEFGQSMSGHLLKCSHRVLACVVAEHTLDQQLSTHKQRASQLLAPLATLNPERYQRFSAQLLHIEHSDELKKLLSALATELAPCPDSRAIVLELTRYESAYWNELEQLKKALLQITDGQPSRELDPLNSQEQERLLALLRHGAQESDALAIKAVKTLAGGFSKQTILVELEHTTHLASSIVLRRDRSESPVGSTVLDEFELLKTLHAKGMKVPKPLAVDAVEVMGCPVLVTEKAEGTNIGDVYTIFAKDAYSNELLEDLAQQLALMHRIELNELPEKIPGRTVPPALYTRTELERFYRDWRALEQPCVAVELAFNWLLSHVDKLSQHASLVHCDFRFHNILTCANQVTAVLDWELAIVNHPARDLGYVYHHATQIGLWEDFIGFYCEAGGQMPAALDLDYYRVWSDLFVTVYLFRARQGFLSGATQSVQMAYAGEGMRQHNLSLLAAHIAEIFPKYTYQGVAHV